jgi:hypothetical protein
MPIRFILPGFTADRGIQYMSPSWFCWCKIRTALGDIVGKKNINNLWLAEPSIATNSEKKQINKNVKI